METDNETVLITTQLGRLLGRERCGVQTFLGIRYGRRQDRDRRFSEVEPAPAWDGIQDATTEARQVFPQPVSQHYGSRLGAVMGYAVEHCSQSEDAFHLNLWAPSNGSDVPVFVFIHGGGFMSGGGVTTTFDGERLSRENGIIVVTINYRLGALAHLSIPGQSSGNLPVTDILCALRWVQDHIVCFGGNRGNVTVGGQSAGAWYTWLLSVIPESDGLLKRAILFSLPYHAPVTADFSRQLYQDFMFRLGLQDIETLEFRKIIEIQSNVCGDTSVFGQFGTPFGPVIQGDLVPDWLYQFSEASARAHISEILISHTADESSAFLSQSGRARTISTAGVEAWYQRNFGGAWQDYLDFFLRTRRAQATPYRLLVDGTSYASFVQPATQAAIAMAKHGKTAYLRKFTLQSAMPDMFSPHCFDLPFIFGNYASWSDADMLGKISLSLFETISAEHRSSIACFVRNGKLDAGSAAYWKDIDPIQSLITSCQY